MTDFQRITGRVVTTVFVIALLALIAVVALKQIPKAERPTLVNRPGTSSLSTAP